MKIQEVMHLLGLICLTAISSILAAPLDSPDTLKILAIRVEFQTDEATTTTGNGTFDLTQTSGLFPIDPAPHNRGYFQDHLKFVQNYFRKISRGALNIEGEVFPRGQNEAYLLDEPMTNYNPNTSQEEIDSGLARLLRDALKKADEDPAIDFSRYQSFVVFHAGVGRDIDFGFDDTPQDIPSLFITAKFLEKNLGIQGISVDEGAFVITNGIILPETESQEGLQLGLNGMIVSNIGSQLGLLDLFSQDTRRSGIGRFGLMDAGLFNGDGLLPPLPTAWTRMDAGWETPITIFQAQDDAFTIRQVMSGHPERVYKIPLNDTEYFLLENRYSGTKSLDSLQFVMSDARGELVFMREVLQTHFPNQVHFSDSTGVLISIDNFDRGLPGGGVLIWHIDERIIEANREVNRINADPGHRGVDLEEADGSQDIGADFEIISGGAGSEIGTALDLWYAGNNAPLFQQSPQNEFSQNSTPHSLSYYNRANSHLKIFNFSQKDSVMTFQVNLNFFQPNFPRKIDVNTYGEITSIKAVDLDTDGSEELVFTTGQNKILVMNAVGQSGWGSDSLEVVSLPNNLTLVTPPAFFPLSGGDYGMAVLSRQGAAFGYRFAKATQTVDSLFQFQSTSNITTFPIALGNTIYWGNTDGTVSAVNVDDPANIIFSELFTINQPVKNLLVTAAEILTVSDAGKVFRNGESIMDASADVFQPVGNNAVTADKDGFFWNFSEGQTEFAENGLHRFDSPLIAINMSNQFIGSSEETYLAAGNNHVYFFNYNLTLKDDFPLNIYSPPQLTGLFLAPLVGIFPSSSQEAQTGVLIADPGGLIAGYDLNGSPLSDFPLAVGDSLKASPALLDIDQDGDVELACVTARGTVFVWDFTSPKSAEGWHQIHGNPGNTNLPVPTITTNNEPGATSLMPPGAVYNWPNPNIENYTFIRYRLTESAEVSIKIYDLAGDLVKEMAGAGDPGTDNEVRWDLTGVQSGVYLGRIEANGDGKKGVQIIKIAVVK